jgi:hypothetical protein
MLSGDIVYTCQERSGIYGHSKGTHVALPPGQAATVGIITKEGSDRQKCVYAPQAYYTDLGSLYHMSKPGQVSILHQNPDSQQ